MKKLLLCGVCVIAFTFSGCYASNETKEKWSEYGGEHKIELYSGGKMVKGWISVGSVSEQNNGEYYFKDKKTGKLTRVTGDLVITVIGNKNLRKELE